MFWIHDILVWIRIRIEASPQSGSKSKSVGQVPDHRGVEEISTRELPTSNKLFFVRQEYAGNLFDYVKAIFL